MANRMKKMKRKRKQSENRKENNMTYRDYIDNNRAIAKKYPGIGYAFTQSKETNITKTKVHFVRSGSRWLYRDQEVEEVDYEHYVNCITAIPFFRSLGGKETVYCADTNRGHLPVEVHSISPDKREKYLYKFDFH